MNKLIRELDREGPWCVGVIETPCYPCAYYGGSYRQSQNGDLLPVTNTMGYRKTIAEAFVCANVELVAVRKWRAANAVAR